MTSLPSTVSIDSPLDSLLDALTNEPPRSYISDEIRHTGGVGVSRVERWPVAGLGSLFWVDDAAKGPWLWRVSYRPKGDHRGSGPFVRIAYGVSPNADEAQVRGRREAIRLAKARREAA